MFVAPGAEPSFGYKLTRDAAQQIAGNWWLLLVNGALLVVAGFLIFSIDWSIRGLATFIGVLFIVEGVADALTIGIVARVRRANVVTGLLSIALGAVIIAWPDPGLVAVAIVLGAYLIVGGTVAMTAAFSARRLLPGWWLLLLVGALLQIALGVLALANPGATLAALITVAGIFAVTIGVLEIVLSFEVKRLPDDIARAWSGLENGQAPTDTTPEPTHLAHSHS